jgi:23S rRNA maturation mini-RNase III
MKSLSTVLLFILVVFFVVVVDEWENEQRELIENLWNVCVTKVDDQEKEPLAKRAKNALQKRKTDNHAWC